MKIDRLTTPTPTEPFQYCVKVHWADHRLSRRNRNQTILKTLDSLSIDRKEVSYRYDMVIDATYVNFKSKVDGVDFYVTLGL